MPELSAAAAVSISGLTKIYQQSRKEPAVDGIDIEISGGETYGLLGPNGAGKTTTVSVCTTRTRLSSGHVRVAGWDVMSDASRVRRDIGVVTQFNTLDRSCDVADNLYFHCRFFGMHHRPARARTKELLDAFHLMSKAKMKVAWLSGGMVQRLQIARALAHRPRVLFLDEPTAGLDPQSRLSLWEQLAELKRDGTTIFLTTHYMEEAERLCDRLSIMDRGRLLVTGSPAELIRHWGGETMVTVRVGLPGEDLAGRLRSLPGVRSLEPTEGGYRLSTTGDQACLSHIVQTTLSVDLQGISVSEPTLETVFISLTGRELRD